MKSSRALVEIISILISTSPSMQMSGSHITFSCGERKNVQKEIIGCFASLGNTKYANLEDGPMRGPGGASKIELLQKRKCIFTLELGHLLTPGYYQCGLILSTRGNGTEVALFTSFNASTHMAEQSSRAPIKKTPILKTSTLKPETSETDSPIQETNGDHNMSQFGIAAVTTALLLCLTVLVTILVLLIFKYKKNGKWMTPPKGVTRHQKPILPKRSRDHQTPLFEEEELFTMVPPPMDIIPAESIERYVKRCISPSMKPCGCTKPREKFV